MIFLKCFPFFPFPSSLNKNVSQERIPIDLFGKTGTQNNVKRQE